MAPSGRERTDSSTDTTCYGCLNRTMKVRGTLNFQENGPEKVFKTINCIKKNNRITSHLTARELFSRFSAMFSLRPMTSFSVFLPGDKGLG